MPQNDNFEWLTYETIFQQQRFARTNEKLQMGLYAVPRTEVTVFFRFGLNDELLGKLTDAFFPNTTDKTKHKTESDETWAWKERKETPAGFPVSPTREPLRMSPAVNRLYLEEYVVLPYNHLDNDKRSTALGTSQPPVINQMIADRKWDFWKTASRSCVMRTSRAKQQGEQWIAVFKPWADWDFTVGAAMRSSFRLPSGPPANGYVFKNRTPADFSVKTGVVWVGSEDQKKAEKDNLDSNWVIACLRSDYVAVVDNEMKKDPASDPEIVVLTELLSINEKVARNGKTDGVQVRDISILNKDLIYVPPLSIPVIDKDFKTRSSEFINLTDKEWCDFWRRSWAASLGKAKALFLLRYGLQHLNPNVQNYLIEFEPGVPRPKPTGRVVIRDLQDAALQREVVWALYGPEEPPPPAKEDLIKLKLGVLSYEFTKDVIGDSQETGTTNPQFGPPGMQMLWNRFSMFGGNNKSEEFVSRMFREGNKDTFEKIASAELADLVVAQSPIGTWPESEFMKYSEYNEIADDQKRKKVRDYAANKDNAIELKRLFPNMLESRNIKSTVDAIEETAKIQVTKKQTDVVTKTRKLLLSVMAKWGRSHNLAYVHTTEKILGFNFGIDWSTLPNPDRHLLEGTIDYKSEMEWEEKTAKILEDYISSPDGQKKVRAYKARKWEPAKAKFRLQILNDASHPIEEESIRIIHNLRKWTDMTDREGFVCIYEGEPENYTFVIPSMTELAGSSFNMKELSQKAMFDFGYIKIKFVAG